MLRFFPKTTLLALLVLLLNGCTSFNGHYAVLSNKPINLYDITREAARATMGAEATSSRSIALIIPFSDAPTVEEAVNDLLTKYNGDYIEDAYVYHTSFHLVWLYHYSAWTVRGSVMKINQ